MVNLKANYQGKHSNMKCRRCWLEDETIEYLWDCKKFNLRMPKKILLQSTKMKHLKKNGSVSAVSLKRTLR